MKKTRNKTAPFIPITKNAPAVERPQGNPPTIGQLVNEGKGRCKRINTDQLYLDNLIDTLFQEIDQRESRLIEMQARLDKYEKKAEATTIRGVN